jgi:alpha-L-rhamnosidase
MNASRSIIEHREPPPAVIARLEKLLREARWIWAQQPSYDNFNSYARFTNRLQLATVPPEFWVAVSADQSYQLSVNGVHICRGPARGYQSSWPFDVVDLAPFLQPGANEITARVYFPSEGNFFYICKGFPGFIFAAEWDGGKLLTDASWESHFETAHRRLTKKSSTQLFRQEHVDLRKMKAAPAPPSAPVAGSRATHASTDPWPEPRQHHSFIDPWPAMEHRGIPMLREVIHEGGKVIGHAEGTSRAGWQDVEDVVAGRAAEGLAHAGIDRPASLDSLAFAGGDSSRFESYLIDFGRVIFGSLALKATGAAGGECVDILYAETVAADSLALELEIEGWNHVALGSRLLLAEGSCGHRFYHPYGFRYAVVTVRNASAPFQLAVTLHTTGYPIRRNGVFRHGDPQWESIWEACAHTQEICAHDAFVDTPWREQAQWWGDARYQGENVHWLMGDDRLYARGIRSIGAQRTPTGLTYGLAPSVAYGCVLPDFSLAWILTIGAHHWHTGRLDAFRSQKEGIREIFGYFQSRYESRFGLTRSDPRHWLFLDWAPIYRGAYAAILNFILLWALQTTAKLARLDGDDAWERELTAWAADLARGLGALRGKDGLYADGLDEKGNAVPVRTIHSQFLAVMTGLENLEGEAGRVWLEKAVLPGLSEDPGPLVKPNLHWHSEMFELLAQHGHEGEVLACIKRLWGPMAAFGSTKEIRDVIPGRHSWSHAWTAHPLVHLMKILGGVRQTSPGWQTATLKPVFLGDRCEVTVPTPRGPLTVAWRREDGGIALRCQVPAGMMVTSLTGPKPQDLAPGDHAWRVDLPQP